MHTAAQPLFRVSVTPARIEAVTNTRNTPHANNFMTCIIIKTKS